MKEKFVNGVIGGIIAGVLKDIPDVIFRYVFKAIHISFWDYSGVIALGRYPRGFIEQIHAFFFELIFSIFIGIVFVYLASYFQTSHFWLRGGIYGALIWFTIRIGVIAFQIEPLQNVTILASVIHSLSSILYGIALGSIIHYLENNF